MLHTFLIPCLKRIPASSLVTLSKCWTMRRCEVLMIIWTLATWACVSERVCSHVRWGLRESQILGVLLFRLCVITVYQPIYHPLNLGETCHRQLVSCTPPPPPYGDFLL